LDRQRIDKWLWHARVVRTRSAAAALAASGHVRVNGQRIDAASRAVHVGDVVTVALDRTVRVLKVGGFAERRGAAESARALAGGRCAGPARSRRRATEQARAAGNRAFQGRGRVLTRCRIACLPKGLALLSAPHRE
jgi:ribosome-associated heat shock protein Hsp15